MDIGAGICRRAALIASAVPCNQAVWQLVLMTLSACQFGRRKAKTS